LAHSSWFAREALRRESARDRTELLSVSSSLSMDASASSSCALRTAGCGTMEYLAMHTSVKDLAAFDTTLAALDSEVVLEVAGVAVLAA